MREAALNTWPIDVHVLASYVVFAIGSGVFTLIFGERSRVDGWAEDHPRLAGAMKLLRSIGFDPWLFLSSLCLLVRGRLPEAQRKPKLRGPFLPLLLTASLAAVSGACAQSDTIHWPRVLECAPSPEELSRKVLTILLLDTSPELSERALHALEELAREYGPDGPRMVLCAVRQLVADLSMRGGVSSVELAALKRAREFLERREGGSR